MLHFQCGFLLDLLLNKTILSLFSFILQRTPRALPHLLLGNLSPSDALDHCYERTASGAPFRLFQEQARS